MWKTTLSFDKSMHVIQLGLHGFKVKSIDGESTEANDLGEVGLLRK